ncbi:sugar phosphate isomerase/epimerase [Sebaldella sp. S0638]|uniref:sugar phosphate isomerase/epimerase family protein n=1 Tax=Sebaldella sp. S0638 TaxID=2957809 RepID=UPI0020A0BAFA|nr:TIM barrel protein [Sebaldella sp. S0638]MCP1225960.1 sugar phosphate isomerase/epimerase [Sebaldella sp. S0638]
MNEMIQKYFNIGIVHFMAFPETIKGEGPILETVKKIAKDEYFNAIEVTWIKDSNTRRQVKEVLEQAHIKVCYGAQPRLLTTGLNPNHIIEEERQKAEKTLLEAIDEAEELGAKGIAFLAGKYEEETKKEAFEQLLKTTKNLCDYAKKKDMNIVLEVFDFDLDKKSLIGPAPYALKFAEAMREYTNNFGLMVDLSHIPQTYESSKFVLEVLKPYIVHFHIGNGVLNSEAEAFGDTHPRFGFPNSENDINEVLEFLKCIKNTGFLDPENPMVLSFEVKPWKDEDPDIIIANSKRVLNRAWSLL